MKRSIKIVLPVFLLLITLGCSTAPLNTVERRDWGILQRDNVVSDPIPFKNPRAAVIWDIIIPGTGSTYAGGGRSWGWILGGILTWPASAVYQPFIGSKIVRNENTRRTVEYYKSGSHNSRLEKLKTRGKLSADFKSREEARVVFA